LNIFQTQNDLDIPGQEIVGKSFTGPVIVKGKLDVLGGINGLDVTKAVTVGGDQVITSKFFLKRCS